MTRTDTIVAPATPPGRGGIGIVRVSGPKAPEIAAVLLGELPPARTARFARFLDAAREPLDAGLALFFPAPHSYTGEHVLELHGHGGPAVLEAVVQRILEIGARRAQPGEFTLRAFLNNKLDLAQAEAIADLIDAGSREAARAAMRSLQGEFSAMVHGLTEAVTDVRAHVEAAIDFPEEEVDFLADRQLHDRFHTLRDHFTPGGVVARGHDRRDRRALQCRQVEPAQPPGRVRGGDRHADSGHDARHRARADRHRRHAAARTRHRGIARQRRCRRGGRHPPGA
jgi:tRNA U34 5-carboxymethylaminomethyl modifying GTPase MnmE/TrmE